MYQGKPVDQQLHYMSDIHPPLASPAVSKTVLQGIRARTSL